MDGMDACGAMIKQIHDEMEKRANNSLRPLGITIVQAGVLTALENAAEGQMSLKRIEQDLHVAQSTAAGIVARLEQNGFVEGFSDAEDRRVKMVRITKKGRNCCQDADQKREEAENELLAGLTETEQIFFRTLLQKVLTTLK